MEHDPDMPSFEDFERDLRANTELQKVADVISVEKVDVKRRPRPGLYGDQPPPGPEDPWMNTATSGDEVTIDKIMDVYRQANEIGPAEPPADVFIMTQRDLEALCAKVGKPVPKEQIGFLGVPVDVCGSRSEAMARAMHHESHGRKVMFVSER